MYTVELYGRVRRDVQVEGKSERQVAREYGLARETVRKMMQYAAPHGQKNLPTIARGARIQRWVHHREGLRASAEAEPAGDVRAPGASAGRRPGGLRGSAGGDRRRGAEGALSGDRSAAIGRLLCDRIPGRDNGGVSGRVSAGVRILRRSTADAP